MGAAEVGAEGRPGRETLWKFVLVGIFLGVVFTKAEVISWFRIQEMFRFQSFHMYGIIGSAVFVGAISILLIRRLEARTVYGDPIRLADKESRGELPVLDRRRVVRARLGSAGRVPRADLRPHRKRSHGAARVARGRPGRHLELWLAQATPATPLREMFFADRRPGIRNLLGA